MSGAAARAEVVGDFARGDTGAGESNEFGFSQEEMTAWNAMQGGDGAGPAVDDAGGANDGAADVGTGTATPPADPNAQPPLADDDDDEPAPQPDPKTGKVPGRQVNYQKYKREMEKRDAALRERDERISQLQTSQTRLDERLRMLNEALTAAPAAPQPQAGAEEDPDEPKNPWLEKDIDVEENAIEAIKQMRRRQDWNTRQNQLQQHETAADRADRDLQSNFERDARVFSGTEEGRHFASAYQFLKDHRLTELAMLMFDKDVSSDQFTQAEIQKLVATFNAEEKDAVRQAFQRGQSPARATLRMAKARGWRLPEAAAPQGGNGAGAGGATRAAAAPAAGAPPAAAAAPAARAAAPAAAAAPGARSVVDQIRAEEEAALAARSLSDGGGAPPPTQLTPESLANMGEEEFQALLDRMPQRKIDELLGRPAT